MKTAQQYKDSLRERNIRVYVKGQLLNPAEVIDRMGALCDAAAGSGVSMLLRPGQEKLLSLQYIRDELAAWEEKK